MEDATYAPECPRCHQALPADATEGLCPACLLAAGIGSLSNTDPTEAPTMWSVAGRSGALTEEQSRPTPSQTWGPYRIGSLLGRGGMGEVYEAENVETGRRVALKVLRGRLRNADDRARFLREGQLAASVSHPHTVYIYGSEEIEGAPAITMELLPGGTLKDRVVERGPLPPAEAVAAILDIIGGLDAAQAAGVLHRDIKPSNCFLDREGAVKVGDFGLSISTLARDVQHGGDSTGFQGTPQFAAPEQLRGEPLDIRADIYAVGATMFYLLTGQPVFDSRDLRDLVARVTNDRARSPRELRPEVPAGLAALVLRCLAKNPADRPQSYAALAADLRLFAPAAGVPASLTARFLAFVIDSILLSFPGSIVMALSGTIANRVQGAAAPLADWAWVLTFAYFFITESLWGATLGKRILGLRVTTTSRETLPFARLSLRTAIYFLPTLLLQVAAAAGLATPGNFVSLLGRALRLVLFVSARPSNGWMGLHEKWSGSCVIRSAVVGSRRRTPEAIVATGELRAGAGQKRGPFDVSLDAKTSGRPQTLPGFDAVLRRPVWVRDLPGDTPPLPSARRDLSRPGRLHWLTGKRSDRENWDAYEAPRGRPLLDVAVPVEWPVAKLWLQDLVNELNSAHEESSPPELALDRLWVRDDGGLVLLDFPAPGISADTPSVASAQSPVGLVSALAAHILPGPAAKEERFAVPLSARRLVKQLSAAPLDLKELSRRLAEATAAPERVAWQKRAIPMALAMIPLVIVMVAATVFVPMMGQFIVQNGELLSLLEMLNRPTPTGRLTDSAVRGAIETYVSGRYASVLDSNIFWNGAFAIQFKERRAIARDILSRHPSVTEAEMHEAEGRIAPELALARRRLVSPAAGGLAEVRSIIIGVLMTICLLGAFVVSLVSSLMLPGGVVTRGLGLAVVDGADEEIGRGRSVLRAATAWLPCLTWFGVVIASLRLQGFVPFMASGLPAFTVVIGIMAAGALWTLLHPMRGPHDRLTGVWVVPR